MSLCPGAASRACVGGGSFRNSAVCSRRSLVFRALFYESLLYIYISLRHLTECTGPGASGPFGSSLTSLACWSTPAQLTYEVSSPVSVEGVRARYAAFAPSASAAAASAFAGFATLRRSRTADTGHSSSLWLIGFMTAPSALRASTTPSSGSFVVKK